MIPLRTEATKHVYVVSIQPPRFSVFHSFIRVPLRLLSRSQWIFVSHIFMFVDLMLKSDCSCFKTVKLH